MKLLNFAQAVHRGNRQITGAMLLAVVGLIISVSAAAAWQFSILFTHNSPYNESNNYPYGSTAYYGQLDADTGTSKYLAEGSWIEWNQAAINWILSNRGGSWSSNEFQVAIVFHAFLPNSQTCANVGIDWWASNLPGAWAYQRSNCELREFAGDPTQLSTSGNYYAQIQYADQSGGANGEINIDNYWVDTQWQTVSHRDWMGKFCYGNGRVWQPTNGNCP
jgi:hypothetical protein